jgi:rubredoxin
MGVPLDPYIELYRVRLFRTREQSNTSHRLQRRSQVVPSPLQAIAHLYYRRSAKEAPEWAQPLIDSLPDSPVSPERLVELYNDAFASGEMMPHQFTGFVKCPKCDAGQEFFEPYEAYDDHSGRGVRGFRCSKCGYELSGEDI